MRTKIAHLVHSLNLGGAERLAVDMAMATRDEFAVSIICLDEPGLWAGDVRESGIPVHCLYRQPGMDLRLAWILASLAREEKIHVIHAHQCTPWFYAGLSRLFRRRTRLVFEEHGRHYPEVANAKRAMVNRLLLQPLTFEITAVSDDVRKRLVRYEGISSDRIRLIYNGAKPPPFVFPKLRISMRRQIGLDQEDFVLGTVGRFDPVKNLPLFIRAVSQCMRKHPRVKAVLVGDGPCMREVKELASSLCPEGSVVFTGYRSDTDRLVSVFDLFVLTSLSEGTSMALLDAMAAGVPAIVTDVGGNPEIVKEKETGWLVPSGSLESLVQAISDAAERPELIRSLGDNGRKRYERYFTFDRMAGQYRAIYRSAFETLMPPDRC